MDGNDTKAKRKRKKLQTQNSQHESKQKKQKLAKKKKKEKGKKKKKKALASRRFFSDKPMSSKTSRSFFEWLIAPISIQTFYKTYFEKKPMIIQRHPESKDAKGDQKKFGLVSGARDSANADHYYTGWFGREEMDSTLRNHTVNHGEDIDITTYSKSGGRRKTLELSGQATAEAVWKHADDGCSIRFLCPQRFSRNMWRMINLFEDFTGMGAGANTYWTPAKTQGFAPHYDEVDIFVLQTEGAKRWRLYPPRDASEILPQFSSRNFEQFEIGRPFCDVVLRKGDFLYAPRGTIHQCVATEESSLHITLSSCLRVSWADYMKKLLPHAIDMMFQENVEFRKVLPQNFHKYMGLMHCDDMDEDQGGDEVEEKRAEFKDHFLQLITSLVGEHLPHDAVADDMALDFMHGRVPPSLPQLDADAKAAKVKAKSRVRLVQAGVARLLDASEDEVSLHYTSGNSRLHKGKELGCKKYPITYAPALEQLILAYPKPIVVNQLPFPTTETDDPPEDDDDMDPQPDEAGFARQRERQLRVVQELVDLGVLTIVIKKNKKKTKAQTD